MVFVAASGGFLIGSSIAARYVMRLGIDRTMGIGAAVLLLGGVTMTALIAADVRSAAALALPMGIYVIGMGGVFPQTIAGALVPFRHNAGAAASLASFIQQTGGALVGVIVGIVIGDSALPLAIIITLAGCLSCTIWALTRRIRGEALITEA